VKEKLTILMDSIITQNKGSLIVHINLISTFQEKATHHINHHITFTIWFGRPKTANGRLDGATQAAR
jgi:hypothetical protein